VTRNERLLYLAVAARDGDDRSLAELIRELQPKVWQMCVALGSPVDPADLSQETFVRMIRGLRGFRGESGVETWVLAIARRACADSIRRLQRQRRLVRRLSATYVEETSSSADSTLIFDMLARIPDERREAFVLTQIVGVDYETAAEIIGCSVGTIRSRVARARADLLEDHRRSEAG